MDFLEIFLQNGRFSCGNACLGLLIVHGDGRIELMALKALMWAFPLFLYSSGACTSYFEISTHEIL